MREMKEETGLVVDPVPITHFKVRLHKKNYDFTYYLFEAVVESSNVTISNEHMAYKWVRPDEICKLNLEIGAEIYTRIIGA